jgi:tetratricopeptide (TPR) repeat protein
MRITCTFVTAPEQIEDLFDEANGDVALGELEAAAEKYAKCVELDPEFFEGWQALALALGKLDRLPEGIAAALKAVELNPNDGLIWTTLSQLYVKAGDIPAAEDAKAKSRIIGWGGKVDRMRL